MEFENETWRNFWTISNYAHGNDYWFEKNKLRYF